MEAYGLDDERPGSPLLEKQEIRYQPSESPPPFRPDKSSSSSPDGTPHPAPRGLSKGGKKRRKQRTQATQGDSVLISYLAPNHPDIAREVGIRPLPSASESEAEESDDEGMPDRPDRRPNEQVSDSQGVAAKIAQDALNHIPQPLESSEQPILSHPRRKESTNVNGIADAIVKKGHVRPIDAEDADAATGPQRLSESSRKGRKTRVDIVMSSDENSGEDSSVMSPSLRKNMIPAPKGSLMQTLPAIQKSPPASASASSPDGAQKLPSIDTIRTVAGTDSSLNKQDMRMNGTSPVARTAFPPFPGQSPPLNRTDRIPPFPPQQAPTSSPYSCEASPQNGKEVQGMSPPGMTQPHVWPRKLEAPYTPSTTISDSQPTPQSTEGPGAYPTPDEHRLSIDGERPALINGPLQPNGPFTSSGFKCTHSGCTAPPFQTQYLLNSHANVHSQNRPHYCHVKGCPRGVGGRGFKRKNEMIRHGLVHESPGYVCPYCPDQQHKYPRPDNLQRHVRVHHGDKDKDDPQLRQVLAQRPEGGNRGRRRRMLP